MKKYMVISLLQVVLSLFSKHDDFVFHDHEVTMHTIMDMIALHKKGSYFRTGDGDVNLALGLSSGTHPVNPSLEREMKEAFLMDGGNILKSLPVDLETYKGPDATESYYINKKYVNDLIKKASKVWGKDRNVYSAVFLSHYAVVDMDRAITFLTFLKNSNCSLLIGNENIPSDIVSLLFGNDCIHVKTPQTTPYNVIDEIEQKSMQAINALDPDKHHVIIMCVGNTGRVLVKRIYEKVGSNVFFFDFGSLIDAIAGFESRIWIRTFFNRELFIEKLKSALME